MRDETTVALWSGVAAATVAVLAYVVPRVRRAVKWMAEMIGLPRRVTDLERRITTQEMRKSWDEEQERMRKILERDK